VKGFSLAEMGKRSSSFGVTDAAHDNTLRQKRRAS
jgi:hypothetical protein